MSYYIKYKPFIEDNFAIVDKTGSTIPFVLNPIQNLYVTQDSSQKDVILKARQQGFSSLILAIFATDFILKQNTRSVVVADIDDNASELLDRVKLYIRFYEEINKIKIPLKYNSKSELLNEFNGSRYTIGTAKNTELGRSKTIHNLHLSEFAFYPNAERNLASVVQAVPENGRIIIETTANGFNYFKEFWDKSVNNESGYKAHFYGADKFYLPEFLDAKKQELGRLYKQEYPSTPQEAFLSSGDLYFDGEALERHMLNVIEPTGAYL